MEALRARPLGERKLTPRGRTRLVLEIDEPLHRALKTEAARRDASMREYVSRMLERGLDEDVALEGEGKSER